MRNGLLILMLFCFGNAVAVQPDSVISSENYANEIFQGVNIRMSDYREINSGAKLIVKYSEECPEFLKGAFEHAVKLWEEVLPETLPINIEVKVEPIRGRQTVLSKVNFPTYKFNGPTVNEYAVPLSMVKGVVLQEYHHGDLRRFFDEIDDIFILEEPDMIISYNEKLLDEFSYSLEGNPDVSKYDFVTMAMRDIAIGLGFTTNFTANINNKEIDISGDVTTPFQSRVAEVLSITGDANESYINATKGIVPVSLYDMYGELAAEMKLYAPINWTNGVSLRYFIPEDGHPLTRLLTYDFGKGYIMRDLSGENWSSIFCGALDWRRYVSIGNSENNVNKSGVSTDRFPYRGTINVTFDGEINNVVNQYVKCNNVFDIDSESINFNNLKNANLSLIEYCKKFDHYSPDGPAFRGISVSVLKKDGGWDCIYTTNGNIDGPIIIDIENLSLNYPEDNYARGTTGGLRYRVTRCMRVYDSLSKGYYAYDVKYFTRDFTPQSAVIKLSEITSVESNGLNRLNLSRSNDEYFIDAKIELSNLEGTTRLIVEQLDENETFPFQYEVTDFQEGYFIANLDRESSSKLTVISYNDNGFRRSNTITIDPIGYPDITLSFNRVGNEIIVNGIPDFIMNSGELYYELYSPILINQMMIYYKMNSNTISISNIKFNTPYILNIRKKAILLGTYKFIK